MSTVAAPAPQPVAEPGGSSRGAVLTATGLHRFFRSGDEEVFALRGVDLTVDAGELVVVVGPSGSGKSTLLVCLAGLDEPAGGSVTVSGTRLTHRPESYRARVRARSIGVLLQSGNLLDQLSIRANIALVQRARGGDPRRTPDDLLGEVGLTNRAPALPRELSGGETARAGLAVAMANDPPLLLADEPTGELDGRAETDVLRLLRARADSGTAVLVVTHAPRVIEAADRVVTLRDGVAE